MDKLLDVILTLIAVSAGLLALYFTNGKNFTVESLIVFLYVTHIVNTILLKKRN